MVKKTFGLLFVDKVYIGLNACKLICIRSHYVTACFCTLVRYIVTSAKKVMFYLAFVSLFVSSIMQNVFDRFSQKFDRKVAHWHRFVMKLFITTNVEVVQASREVFYCELPSVQLTKRYKKLIGLNDHCDYLQ